MSKSNSKKKPPEPEISLALKVTGVFRSLMRAFKLLGAVAPWLTGAMGALSLTLGVLPAAIAIVSRGIIDGVMRAVDSGRAEDRVAVLWTVATEMALITLLSATRKAYEIAQSVLRARLAQHVNEMIIEKALTLSLADFENPDFYDKLNRAYKGASYRPLSLVSGLFGFIRNMIALATCGVLLLRISPWLVFILAAATVPDFIVELKFSSDAFRLFSWRSTETRKQSYLESLLTREDYAKEVKLFALGPMLLKRYRAIFETHWKEDRDLTLRRGLWSFLLGVVSTLGFYFAYGWITYDAMVSKITLGELSMYVMLFKEGQGTLGSVLDSVSSAYEDHLYLSTLFEFLAHRSAQPDAGGHTAGPDPRDGLRFENVSFSYPGAEKPALEGLTLHVPAGRKLAVVGENGAGKTTLIKLMTRLYSPTAGKVTLDGRDLAEWDQQALWHRIGVIFQDYVHYQFTVGENIGVGDVARIDDEEGWKEAAERGMASEFIDELPEKYQTQLGKWFTDGQELSLGQWQKIALARAFMRRGADILVLDEPTASMDAEAESKIFQRFQALAADRTAVLISHRFSTVRMADSIAVLSHGKLIEQGTHDDLIAKNGRYAELFFMQARGYR